MAIRGVWGAEKVGSIPTILIQENIMSIKSDKSDLGCGWMIVIIILTCMFLPVIKSCVEKPVHTNYIGQQCEQCEKLHKDSLHNER